MLQRRSCKGRVPQNPRMQPRLKNGSPLNGLFECCIVLCPRLYRQMAAAAAQQGLKARAGLLGALLGILGFVGFQVFSSC